MKVRDVMARNPMALPPTTSVATAAVALAEGKVGGCPVVDPETGAVVGMLTETNILEALAQQHRELRMLMPPEIAFGISFVEIVRDREAVGAFAELRDRPISEIMTREVVTVAPSDDVETVIRAMVKRRIHRVPVLEGGKVVGIVTRTDILRGFFRTLETPTSDAPA